MGPLFQFFMLSYALTWTCFITVAVAVPANTPLGYILVLLGAFAPSLAAIWVTARAEGSAGVRALLGHILRWRTSAKWYVFAVIYIVVIKLGVSLLHRLATGAWPRFGQESLLLIAVSIAVSTPFQAGEEVGWRGYALPRLTARFGLATASLLLGIIWACWHLPQFFIRQADTYHQSFPLYALQVTALSVALAWLYAKTNGSLLLTMLMHAAVNNAKDIVPSATLGGAGTFGLHASLVAWLTVALLCACAGYFLFEMRTMKLAA